MAHTLIKKEIDDEIVASTPKGNNYWTVLTIVYKP
jgi:transcription elongation GreA/GreB family factor